MKKAIILLFSIVLTGVLLSSCGSVSQSDEVGNGFYEAVKAKDLQKVIAMLDEEALKATSQEVWVEGLENINAQMGDLMNYKRTGFYTSTNNGDTRTTLDYTVTYAKGTLYEKLEFIKRGDEYKITFYQFNENKSELDK